MTERDIELIAKRRAIIKQELSQEMQKPKEQRNQDKIADLHRRQERIKEWLGTHKPTPLPSAPAKKRMTKKEFKEQFKSDTGLQETKHTMLITSAEHLRNVWPLVMGQNIELRFPPDMSEDDRKALTMEARALHKANAHKIRKNGFR